MKYLKSSLVGCGAAGVASLLYLVFYSRTIQINGGLFGGAIMIEPPLIQPPLIAVFLVSFALGFFLMARRQRAA